MRVLALLAGILFLGALSLPAAINEYLMEDFSTLSTSNWLYGTGSTAATVSSGDVFAVNVLTLSQATATYSAVTSSVLLVQDYPPYATSSAPIAFHSAIGVNVLTTSNKIMQLNVDMLIDAAITSGSGNSNIALGKTVTASATDTADGFTTGYVVDGIDGTSWVPAGTVTQSSVQWLTVDLGSAYNISAVNVEWDWNCATNYLIQVSSDNSTWVTTNTVSGFSVTSGDGVQWAKYTMSTSARYVRLYMTARASYTSTYQVYELQVFGTNSALTTTTSGYPVCRMGLFDNTSTSFNSAYNSVSLRVDPNTSTNNVAIMASSSSGAQRSVASFSTPATNIVGFHSYSLQLDYSTSTTTPVVRAYNDGLFIGAATLSGTEGIYLGGSGTTQGKAVRVLLEATSTATSGANLQFDNIGFASFSAGTMLISTATSTAPTLVSVVSRRTHGSYGNFDIPVNYAIGTSAPTVSTVESRTGNATNLILSFDKRISSASVAIAAGTATVGTLAYSTSSPYTVTIPLTGITNAQKLQVKVTNITSLDGGVLPSVIAAFGYLIGDCNGDTIVNSTDGVVVRNATGANANQSNFRADVNADGVVNSTDGTIVRNATGTKLP